MRMRKKKNLDVRMEVCDGLLIHDPAQCRGQWRELKEDTRQLRLELGCGKGRFTAEMAAAHPDDLYVAVERVPDAMVIAMERCQQLGLDNVFFIDGDAARLDQYFAPGEVDLIYVNFCDPWPSVKHARRRLTHEGFLRSYRQVLAEGGQIHFKTDNRDLFEWSLFQFPKAGYTLSEVTRDLHGEGIQGIMTDYEEKFHSQGNPIHRCVGTMGPLPDVPVAEGLAQRLERWSVRPLTGEDLEASGLSLSSPHPRCQPQQEQVLALELEDRFVAVLDIITGYPRPNTLWIDQLQISGGLRRQGLGQEIISALCQAGAGAGLERIRLSCLQSDPGGRSFWEAVGFQCLREDVDAEERPVWIMEQLAQRVG